MNKKTAKAIAPNAAGQAISLSPASAVAGDPADIVLTVAGAGFTADSVIYFNGLVEPTTLISDSQVSTGVKPSLFVVPAVCAVYVVTGEEATAEADFTFTEVPSNAATPDDLLTRQLRALGISGEPVSWAWDTYQPSVVAIRAANTGFGTQATVQGVLDSSFPFNTLNAADVCLPHALDEPNVKVTTKDGKTRLLADDLAELGLPAENITWRVDGDVVANGTDVSIDQLEPGDHVVVCEVAVAGVVHTVRKEVTDAHR